MLGVFDPETHKLQLLPVAGGRAMRMEPRLPGLNYNAAVPEVRGRMGPGIMKLRKGMREVVNHGCFGVHQLSHGRGSRLTTRSLSP